MTVELVGEAAGFPFLGEGTRTQLWPCVLVLMALDIGLQSRVVDSQVALCWAGFRSWEVFQSSAGPAQAAFLSPWRGSPAAGPSQDLGNATAGTIKPLPALLRLHTQGLSCPLVSPGSTKEL